MPAGDDSSRDRLLHQVARELTSSLELDQVLRNVMDRVIELMNASRGFVVLVDPVTASRQIRIARGDSPDQDASEFLGSRTVIEQVLATGEPVLTTDASADERFRSQESVILHNLRSIIAAPLVVKGKAIGAVYVDNPLRAGIFGEADREFLQAIADQAAIAIENARLYTELRANYEHSDRLRRIFERYVNKQVMERVLAEPNGGFLEGERLRVTMLASDIAGFSALSREMEAERMVKLLNNYFRRMVDVVLAHGGNIDKFQGDGLLVAFGAPVPVADSAPRAVRAALAMRAEIAEFNRVRMESGEAPIEVGIGLDTGPVVAGNVGSERRLEYTLIGVPVNNASFLCKIRPAALLLSQNTYQALQGSIEATVREPITLKGSTEAAPVYSLDA
ncbi:MAG: adenylate/guanylate cyclase domain-containing protein [Candidatus Dormibacteraceae bacterium]